MPRWLVHTLAALVIWGVWGLTMAAVSREVSLLVVQVISILGLMPVALVLAFSPRLRRGQNLKRGIVFAFATGLCANLGNLALLWALGRGGPVALVMPLSSVYPFVTALLAWVFLKERIGAVQRMGLLLAVVAGVVIGRVTAGPSSGSGAADTSWVAPALAALLLYGTSGLLQKLATQYVSTELCTVVFALASLPIAAAILLGGPALSWDLTFRQWLLALLYGVLLGVGSVATFAAYRGGKASIVTGLTGLYPTLTVLLAVPILDERLDAGRILAVSVAAVAGVALGCAPRARAGEVVNAGP